MPKIKLNTTVKIKGKGFVLAGVEFDATEKQIKDYEEKGLLGEVKKSGMPSNEKEIKELVAKVKELESKIKDGGCSELETEITTLKSEIETKDTEITTLKSEIETLKASSVDLLGAKVTKKK